MKTLLRWRRDNDNDGRNEEQQQQKSINTMKKNFEMKSNEHNSLAHTDTKSASTVRRAVFCFACTNDSRRQQQTVPPRTNKWNPVSHSALLLFLLLFSVILLFFRWWNYIICLFAVFFWREQAIERECVWCAHSVHRKFSLTVLCLYSNLLTTPTTMAMTTTECIFDVIASFLLLSFFLISQQRNARTHSEEREKHGEKMCSRWQRTPRVSTFSVLLLLLLLFRFLLFIPILLFRYRSKFVCRGFLLHSLNLNETAAGVCATSAHLK